MKYKEFKKAVKEWGEKYNYKPIVEVDSEYIKLKNNNYIICMIWKLERFVLDLSWVSYRHFSENARGDLFKIVTELVATKPEDREDEKDNLDLIIHRLKEIQTNAEGIMSWEDIAIIWTDIASWTDVISWMTKEIEKNKDLKNNLKDIIADLEEHRKAHSIEGLINEEQKNRQIALELECKAEHYRSKADNYLKMLSELDSCELED